MNRRFKLDDRSTPAVLIGAAITMPAIFRGGSRIFGKGGRKYIGVRHSYGGVAVGGEDYGEREARA